MELKTDYSDIKFAENGKLKLLIIVGTRPEIIRLAAVISKCRIYFDTILAHTGQNYDYNLNGIFFKDLKLKEPEVYMDAVGDDLGSTMGNIISASYKLMSQVKPDAVLVLGDTNSCLSVIGAKRLHIPIFHMEAGNRCKDENFRKRQTAVSSISSVTSTLPIASMLAAILQNADCRRRGHTLPVHQWRKSFIIILKRLRQATFITVSALKRANISFLAPTVRRISTQKRTSLHCSGQSMRWQRSTICRCFIVATQEAANALPQTDSN